MDIPKITEAEYKLCKILWKNEPIKSGLLAKICQEELGWKTTTTYTNIKRLEDRGIIANEKMIVRSLIKEEEAQIAGINELLDTRFGGSYPDFLVAFAKSQNLKESDIEEIRQMIDRIREKENTK